MSDGPLKRFLDATLHLSPDERATALGEDGDIGRIHYDVARRGQTKVSKKGTFVLFDN